MRSLQVIGGAICEEAAPYVSGRSHMLFCLGLPGVRYGMGRSHMQQVEPYAGRFSDMRGPYAAAGELRADTGKVYQW